VTMHVTQKKKQIMKRLLLVLVTFCLGATMVATAQNRKIQMGLHMPLDEVLAKAQAENKYVFLDFGSPRCKPCLWLKANVFTIDSIADWVNERFVSCDYQEGEEKKRLSKKYGVVGEPVLLILDNKGNLMHKMVGKCEPAEFMRRFRQGLDPENNLTGQHARYAKGERSPEFMLSYLESLHIARETDKLKEVVELYLAGPVEKIKEKKYWDVFDRFVESPVSREMKYVMDNRPVFYELFGKKAVDAKIDRTIDPVARYAIFGPKANEKEPEFMELLTYLQNTDYEKATEWLVYMVPARHKFTNFVAMAQEIDNVLKFNLVKGPAKQTYMKMMAEQIVWYSNDNNALPYALNWINNLLPTLTDDETKKSVLYTKVSILKKLGKDEDVQEVQTEISKLTPQS
ncbi:MAG TPA: thioredoxin fold domain-containing protein, partial [Parasegetibacter sp.]